MKRGFTLVEVTVALAIFALCAVILSQSFLSGIISLSSFKYSDTPTEIETWIKREIFKKTKREDFEQGGKGTLPDTREAIWNIALEELKPPGLFNIHINLEFRSENAYTKEKINYQVFRPDWISTLSAEKQ